MNFLETLLLVAMSFGAGVWFHWNLVYKRKEKKGREMIEFRKASGRHRPPDDSFPRLRSAVFKPTASRRSQIELDDESR